MSDFLEYEMESSRSSRPTLAQVIALIDFMKKHTELANKKLRTNTTNTKVKKLWTEMANMLNSIEGAQKSTKGWIKYWADKKRSIFLKKKQIDKGKTDLQLTSLEQKILDLSSYKLNSKKKKLKKEPNSDTDDIDLIDLDLESNGINFETVTNANTSRTENDERYLDLMDKMVEVMDQQSSAMAQVAEASLSHSKAFERLVEASHMQAMAVDRLANTFENVSATVHDIRNALMSLDYTVKRYYSVTSQHRQNPNLFS